MGTHLRCTPTRAAQLSGTGQEVSQGKGKYSRKLPKQKWQRARRTGMQTLTMRGPFSQARNTKAQGTRLHGSCEWCHRPMSSRSTETQADHAPMGLRVDSAILTKELEQDLSWANLLPK